MENHSHRSLLHGFLKLLAVYNGEILEEISSIFSKIFVGTPLELLTSCLRVIFLPDNENISYSKILLIPEV